MSQPTNTYCGPSKHSTRYEVQWGAVAVQSHKGIRRTCIPSQLWGRICSRVRLADKEPHQKSTVLGGTGGEKTGPRRGEEESQPASLDTGSTRQDRAGTHGQGGKGVRAGWKPGQHDVRATVPASGNSQSPARKAGFTLPSSEKAPVLTQLTHLDSGGCPWGGPPSAQDLTPPLSSVQRLSCILIFSSLARTFPSAFKHDPTNSLLRKSRTRDLPWTQVPRLRRACLPLAHSLTLPTPSLLF